VFALARRELNKPLFNATEGLVAALVLIAAAVAAFMLSTGALKL
jgi:hypothetical protein